MSSILLTWELGANLGHLARLLAIATRLRQTGHSVLVALRDVPVAASVLGRFEIPFIQGPCLTIDAAFTGPNTSYAEILLAHGWRDPALLWSYVSAWTSLYRVIKPDMIVHDASPCARLASWICAIPSLYVGNGYDVPPDVFPLPPFPGMRGSDLGRASRAEKEVLANANAVIAFYKGRFITGLRELFTGTSMLATFPELDQYGARGGASYTGTLCRSSGEVVSSASLLPQAKHVFAYLRPTPRIAEILQGLMDSGLNATGFAPGVDRQLLAKFQTSRLRWYDQPIQFDCLYDSTHVCFSYAAEGTVTSFLLKGIPQVMVPSTAEGMLTAERVRQMGAGVVMRGSFGVGEVKDALLRVTQAESYRRNAETFGAKYFDHNPAYAADRVVDRIGEALGWTTGPASDVPPRREYQLSPGACSVNLVDKGE